MKSLAISSGKFVKLDDDDYEYLSQWKWSDHGKYARRYQKPNEPGGKKTYIYMHRFIMLAPSGMVVDHINGDSYDNRRENLRLCTTAENSRNRRGGVYYYHSKNRWMANVTFNYRMVYRKSFASRSEALEAYNNEAAKYFGSFFRPAN